MADCPPDHIWRCTAHAGIYRFGFERDARFYAAIEGLVLLRDAACKATGIASKNKGKSADDAANRRAELLGMAPATVHPIDHVLGGVLGIWTEVLGREIRMSLDPMEGKVTGPLIRFTSACLKSLSLEATEEAVRARIRTMVAARRQKS